MSERPATFAAFVQTLKESVGKTQGEMVLDIMKHYEPDDPRRLFWEWLVANSGRYPEACQELGIECPAEGKGFVRRIMAVAMPRLEELQKERG